MERCYLCESEAHVVREPREVSTATRKIVIEDEFYRCTECGETYYTGDMADASFRRAAEALRAADGLMQPEDIAEIRARYGWSPTDLERVLEARSGAVVRWERGTVAQDKMADILLRTLRDHPDIAAEMARERGVAFSVPRRSGETPAART